MNIFFNQLTKVIFLVVLLLFSEQISAQRRPTRPSSPNRPTSQQVEKSYKIDEILIMKPGDMSKGISYEDSEHKLIRLLGNPTKIDEYYNEMHDKNEKLYYYNKNKIYIREGKVFYYELLDNTLAFGKLNAFQIKVGDNITYRNGPGGRRGAAHIKDFEPLIPNNTGRKIRNLEYDIRFFNNNLRDSQNDRLDIFFSILFSRGKVISIYLGD